MKKLALLLSIVFTVNVANGQKKREKLEEYTASNGITYKIGDEIKLGKGSDINGKFVYVNTGSWATSENPEIHRLPSGFAGLTVTIKKVYRYNYKFYKGLYLTIGVGYLNPYIMDLENAIAACEVENCTKENGNAQSTTDKYDQLAKLKNLLEDGALSEKEYDAEKKKILDQEK